MNDEDPKAPPVHPPSNMAPPPMFAQSSSNSFVDTLIPTKNVDSLKAYYLGLFSIAPLFGLIIGPIAFLAGRRALRAVKADPKLPGKTHAVVGIGCGWIGFIFNLLIVTLFTYLIFISLSKSQ